MSVFFDPKRQLFHLQSKDTSYIIQIQRNRYVSHLYWGRRIKESTLSNEIQFKYRSFSPNPPDDNRTFSLDTLPQEYSGYGNGDFRIPAYQVKLANGSTVTDLRYDTFLIQKGKPPLMGLPATYIEDASEATTLKLILRDQSGLKVVLSYTVFENLNAITRSVQFENHGEQTLTLQKAMSAMVDFRHDEFELLTLYGAHANERNMAKRPIYPGSQQIESIRGASSHQQNPFFALMGKNACEEYGEVYAFSFVYSGNFLAQIEVDQFHTTRASIGIHPFDFSWLLEPGETFQTPEAVLVYSYTGLEGMSHTFHHLYRFRLARGKDRDCLRPILLNNWEATYFKFTSRKLVELAEAGKMLGIELFVLDDGWFGKRDNAKTSLGDWVVNRRKIPEGLKGLAEKITGLGMDFGLWFEPEMVSVDSELYRRHPDWCIHVPDRPRSLGRHQLVLDLSRREVCEYIIEAVAAILSMAPIRYVKWDMNRHMTEVGSPALPVERQRETGHRYILGLYYILENLIQRFPDVLFESCSGGGGRFDPGMLYYMPQVWTSDNTDAISRLRIQYGTSLVYPVVSMGAHVSASPNHQVHRHTSLSTRGDIAMSGNLGYELDVTKLSIEEKEVIRQQIRKYKKIRATVQFGKFYRLINPFETNQAAWQFVSENQMEAVAVYCRILAQPAEPFYLLKLKGLIANAYYRHHESGKVFRGDELMYAGLSLPELKGDYQSLLWVFNKISENKKD